MSAPIVPPRGRLLRARGVAEYLGISEHKARTLIAQGELVALRTRRGRLMGVYEQDCDAWVEARRRPLAPAATPDGDARIAHLLPEARRFA